MKIFLTGASGVVGSRVVPLLVSLGHDVTVATRPGSSRTIVARPGVTPVPLDIFDAASAERVMRGHDVAINLATRVATGTVRPFLPGAWKATGRIRTFASRALSTAASNAGVKRFIQESFAPIYEDRSDRWIDEASAVRPGSYNRSVLDAEQSVEQFRGRGGEGITLRFAFFYGEHDAFTHTINDSIRRGWVPLFGRPDAYFPMVHHDDAAAAVIATLGAPSGIYNVVDSEPLTRREIGDALARQLGVKSPRMLPSWMGKLAGSIGETLSRSLRISSRKLREQTAWTPTHPSVRDGWPVA